MVGASVPAFDKVAFELKPGQLSDVVTTQFGYHIVQVEERKSQSLGEIKPEEAVDVMMKSMSPVRSFCSITGSWPSCAPGN